MSKAAKILWLVSGLSLVILFMVRYILGAWIGYLFIPLGLFLLGTIAALAIDFKFYLEFLTMKTTKHGMNMGLLILMGVLLFCSVNYFSLRFNKTWDLTEERLFSLADQSQGLINNLDSDIEIKIFYRGAQDNPIKQQLKNGLDVYPKYSSKVRLQFIDIYVDNLAAKDYLGGEANIAQPIIFVEYQGKRVRVEQPYDEQNITSAMIRATRKQQNKVYFLTGHGEPSLDSGDVEGLGLFKKSLENAAFLVEELNLLQGQSIPEDAKILALVSPKLQVLEEERKQIIEYLSNGGRLFLALDPGEKHQAALLTKQLGVEFKNNFILNDYVGMRGRGKAGSLGLVFDGAHDITKKFIGSQGYVFFDVVSELSLAPGASETLTAKEIIKTAPNSYTVNSLRGAGKSTEASQTMVVVAEGKVKPESSGEFKAVIFGDGDFVSGKDIALGFNNDLALNAMAYLVDQGDLISIQPKSPKGTELALTNTKQAIMVIAGLVIPFLFICGAGFAWYRRRNA